MTIRNKMPKVFQILLGGRPMKRIASGFVDIVSGNSVDLYEDSFGRRWYAESPWSQFRVRKDP